MKRTNRLLLYTALCTVILSGCGRKDVIYDASSVDDQSDEATKSVAEGLSEALGIENGYRWKDTLQGKRLEALHIA